MPTNVQLTDFPPILRLTFNQASDHRPGRCMVETTVTSSTNITEIPRLTTLQITTDTFTGQWQDMRVIKTARVRYGKMRLVLEDSRWKFWETTMNQNFNDRTSLGAVLTSTQKTVSELLAELATATGLTITTGTLPSFYPPAKWAGRNAGECLGELLRNTGCRMVYNPILSEYKVSSASTGPAPDATRRIFRPAPANKFKELVVRSRPVLYEDTIACTAKEINTTTGATQVLSTSTLPASLTEDYGQTRFRLWEPDSVTHPAAYSNSDVLYFDKRAKAHLFDPENPLYERARIVRDSFVRHPVHQPMGRQEGPIVRLIEVTGGGKAFLTDHPVLMTDGTGALLKTCDLVTSYHVIDTGELKRESVTVPLAGSTGTKTIDVDWIKPVDSTLPDMTGPVWSTLHSEVAEALANFYRGDTGTIIAPTPFDLSGSGQVGAVKYEMRVGTRTRVYFTVSVNFTPGSQGDLR